MSRFTALLLLLTSIAASAADANPNRVIQLDIGRNWIASNWGGGPFPKTFDLDMDTSGATFLVSDPGTRQTFLYKFDLPIDTRRYPLITMKYRARSTDPASSLYNLWIDDSTGPNGAGMRPFMGSEIVPDEQPHELKADLRKFKAKGPAPQMVLAVACSKTGSARFDLLEMRFEAPTDANLQQLANAAPIAIEVQDAAGKPIKGAKAISGYERINFRRTVATDEKGMATVTPLATETEHQMVHVEAEGMFPVDLVDPEANLQVKLQKSMQISATVTDETGEPIEGAKVNLWIPTASPSNQSTRQRNQFTFKTDSKGKWSSPAVPDPGDNRKPYLQISHPDFIGDESYNESRAPLDQLRDGSAIIVLKKGIEIAGVVLDPSGNPVSGAKVRRNDRYTNNAPLTTTDSAGHFTLGQVKPGANFVTIQTTRFAPELVDVNATSNMKPLEIKLSTAVVLKGKVVDVKDNPVSGATVQVEQWRSHRSLEWNTRTNSSGQFTWEFAPADTVRMWAIKRPGYVGQMKTLTPASASDVDTTFTLGVANTVTGTVADAETGKPIPAFKAIMGYDFGDGQRNWQTYNPTAGRNGSFKYNLDDNNAHVFRIDADGYMVAISRTVKPDETNPTLEFKLKKASMLTGIVLSPTSQPIAKAEILVSTDHNGPYIENGKVQNNGDSRNKVVRSGADGKFSFTQPGEEEFLIAAINDSGYTEISSAEFSKSNTLVIQPWGKIEGDARIGAAPAANVAIHAWRQMYNPGPRIGQSLNSNTDTNGHYIIEKAAAGIYSVARAVKISANSTAYTNNTPVTVEAGKTAMLAVGGAGRPVVGKVVIPPELAGKIDWTISQTYADSRVKQQAYPYPEDYDQWDETKQHQWLGNWRASAEGKAYFEEQQKLYSKSRHFYFHLAPDASFRIDDVLPGEYTLSLMAFPPSPDGNSYGNGEPLGRGSAIFTVPALPDGVTLLTEPLTLPDIKLYATKSANKPGDPAPEITAMTLDGADFSLAALKGKFVLLTFQSPWLRPKKADVDQLKSLYEKYSSSTDNRFMIVTLHIDEDADTAKKRAAAQKLPWTQVHIEDFNDGAAGAYFGNGRINGAYLFSPEAKLVAQNLKGEELTKAITAALSAP